MRLKAPRWAADRIAAQDEMKAARMVALHFYRDKLRGVQKKEIAAALGISRWTLDRDLASLKRVEQHIAHFEVALRNLPTE